MIKQFKFIKLGLESAYLVRPFFASDNRGGFIKDFNIDIFKANNIEYDLKEVFYTISKKGVIRAIHFQMNKQQPKIVRCIQGRIFDVIVDLRPDSPTFGKWKGFYLSGENMWELIVPTFFGHGYLVLNESIVSYKCAEVFNSESDSGIMYNDSHININWPFDLIGGEKNLIISEKDQKLMTFDDYRILISQD